MNILFLVRKRATDIGGLARFTHILTSYFRGSRVVCIKQPRTWNKLMGRFDVVCATDATLLLLGILCKWFMGIPLVVIIYGKDLMFPHWWYQLIIRFLLPIADRIVAISPQTASLAQSYHIDTRKLRVILPGITIGHFKKKQIIRTPWPANARVLLTLGNLFARKGQAWFITQVLPKLPRRWTYVVIGEGSEHDHIQHAIVASGTDPRVFLFSRQADDVVSFLLSKTDVYVSPNQHVPGDFEGFGIAAGEAAAMGIPVITNNVDGISTMIRHAKNGILLPVNARAWVRTITRLEKTPLRLRLGQKAKRYTRKHFPWDATAREYLNLFREVTGKSR